MIGRQGLVRLECMGLPRFIRQECHEVARILNYVALTVYKIDHSAVDENPEARFKCLIKLVGERGFEPPTLGRAHFSWITKGKGYIVSLDIF